ncbi:MAG: isoaspartyl peptidase/L-asparaginase [Sphingobacteriales bacterium]|nr:MAG: isoaspartyl peptidase/L-asparaginase [Sphingobacteriales bacterium]
MFSIALHGGAGTIPKGSLTPEQEAQYREALAQALAAGTAVLEQKGAALDAVIAAVTVLEDNPLFNAGRGAVFNHDGRHEMDAAIICGKERQTGGVCGIAGVKNPVELARLVMEQTEHVLLSGTGAEAFAKTQGVAFEPESYFYNELRYQQWKEAVAADRVQLDHTAAGGKKMGTVGCAVLDEMGNLAAATSTGGLTNKRWGRIGDTPIIGAGTWADNATCAVSCTGTGEYFIRAVVGHEIHALMQYKGLSLQDACDEVVNKQLVASGGEGGLVAVDAQGNVCLPFNSEGMYRAWRKSDGDTGIEIYR